MRSRIETTLEEAVNSGYYPCSRCHPPHLGEDSDQDTLPYLRPAEKKKAARKESSGMSALVIVALFVLGSMDSTPKPKRKKIAKSAHISIENCKKTQVKKEVSATVPIEPEGFLFLETPDQSYMQEAYRELYEGKSISELSGLPKDIWFDAEGYPHRKRHKGTDDFTVLITQKGKCYHTASCSNASRGHAVNICYAKQLGKAPCEKCKPMGQLPQSVLEYQRISRICKAFGIDIKP